MSETHSYQFEDGTTVSHYSDGSVTTTLPSGIVLFHTRPQGFRPFSYMQHLEDSMNKNLDDALQSAPSAPKRCLTCGSVIEGTPNPNDVRFCSYVCQKDHTTKENK